MSKARTLANLISDNAELADGQISVAEVVGAAPLASPTFTGTVTSTGNIALGDDDELVLGSNRMRLYYSASNNYTVLDSNGTSGFVFDGVNNLSVNIGGSLSGAFTANGVSLYSGGTEKLQVYGSGTIALDDIKVNDDVKIGFGQFHTDLELYHDSATSTNKLVGDLTQTGAFTTDKYNNAEALPDVRPSLLLDFANSKTLDPRITFTRGSTGTYWDGHTTTKAEENLTTNSQAIANLSQSNTTATDNDATAPDGTTTATKIVVGSTTNLFHDAYLTPQATVSGKDYTHSVYVKAGTGISAVYLYTTITGVGVVAKFNISTGAYIGNASGDGYAAFDSYSITDVGNSWYRIQATKTETASNSSRAFTLGVSNTTTNDVQAYNGNGTDFCHVWGVQIEQRSSATAYTATTSSPIVKYQPTLQTAASGEARFDHDPVTGESKGLLIEESRTNYVLYSENFTGTMWSKTSNPIVVNNAAVAPDGTLTAAQVYNMVGASDRIDHSTSTPAVDGATWTYSVWLRGSGDVRINVSSTTGVGGATEETKTLTDEWVRHHVTVTFSNPTGNVRCHGVIVRSASTTPPTVFMWGAQIEQGAFPTSYIPTSGSTVTRSGDRANMSLSGVYSSGPVSMYVEAAEAGDVDYARLVLLSDGTNDNRMQITISESSGYIQSFVETSDLAVAQINVNFDPAYKTFFKAAAAYDRNDFAVTAGGLTVGTDTSGNTPEVTHMYLGSLNDADADSGATFKKVALYPTRLSNATLQAMTEE